MTRPQRKRPYPPENLDAFLPAPEVMEWIGREILAETGALFNPDHRHLRDADLAVLWAPDGYATKGRQVAGTAEMVAFRCSKWQKWRQEQQLAEWFETVPEFLITLDARYSSQADDTAFCALVEHELYHIAHALDFLGMPKFAKDGTAALEIRGHDVEEFVGVVRRYGTGHPEGALTKLVAAAKKGPEVAQARIAGACGTCLLRVA
jgi:hypothetical protein